MPGTDSHSPVRLFHRTGPERLGTRESFNADVVVEIGSDSQIGVVRDVSHAEADAGGKGIGELPEQLPYQAGFNSDYKKDHTCQASAGGGPGGDHAGAWSATEGHERVGSDAGHIATDGRDRILFESCGMRQA